jgi:hypothetical protein
VPNRAADRSAKLVLVERRADRIEVSPCIERRIAKKLEGVTMKGIASRLADGGDYAAVVVPYSGSKLLVSTRNSSIESRFGMMEVPHSCVPAHQFH